MESKRITAKERQAFEKVLATYENNELIFLISRYYEVKGLVPENSELLDILPCELFDNMQLAIEEVTSALTEIQNSETE